MSDRLPVVTIVVPMLNEKGYIEDCLDSFEEQTYPHDRLDVLVLDGGSTDGSREYVDARAASREWLRVVDNPDARASAAFNLGTELAKGDVVSLFSAHGVADPGFVAAGVEALEDSGACGVGGVYRHIGLDPRSTAIGMAMSSPFGMASPHRHAHERRFVDTISHPVYWREALVDVGGFDTTLPRNSDYELNYRLREAGHSLVFDPNVASTYRPRGSLTALWRQFRWYGKGKALVVRKHPQSLKARHLVAPAAVASLAFVPMLMTRRRGRLLVLAGGCAYGAGALMALRRARQDAEAEFDTATFLRAFPTMHAAWGVGFLLEIAGWWRR